ncbi:hypothetical protein PYCC9005_003958 [Savitreella phatthalungensis]
MTSNTGLKSVSSCSLAHDLESFSIIDNDLIKTIGDVFNLPKPQSDTYDYATDSGHTSLEEAQLALASGAKYQYAIHGKVVQIPQSDIRAYTAIFNAATNQDKALRSFASNAKKDSPRQRIAAYLNSRRYICPDLSAKLSKKKHHLNPYFDLWALSCEHLGFVGPLHGAGYDMPHAAKQSHPILPIFMHHFGCGIPDYEALSIIKAVAGSGRLIDLACGNAYWTWLLRREGVQVVATDLMSSTWRTLWANDIVLADAVQFLKTKSTASDTLLLVYPIVGGNRLTERVIESYKGNSICIVGTQNANRYTTFGECTTEEWFANNRPNWRLSVRKPLPSFAGKDDALYVYQRNQG